MPTIDWNRKWQNMIIDFSPSAEETHFGDRWGDPNDEPLLSVRRKFIGPFVKAGQNVVEIGPGGGRLTQFLLAAKHITIVDLNSAVFDYPQQRFADQVEKFSFHKTTGYEISVVEDESIDLVFTFDCFVHVEPEGILAYLHEMQRILKPGAKAVVHYGDINKELARENQGFSRMTQAKMEDLLKQTPLNVLTHDTKVMFHSNVVALQKAV